jgi:hypothetical protein
MTSFPSCQIPVTSIGPASDSSYGYLETMYHLMEIISRRLNPDAVAAATYSKIVENCEAVEELRGRTCSHIQDKSKCKTALDRLQYYAIRLHTSFVISVACRPALRRDCELDPAQKKDLAERSKVNLTETVRMFLAMHQLSVIPTRSWAFTYHGLSSALLLGILPESKSDPEVRQLQGDLIAALSATAAKEVSSPEPHVPISDKDIELSGPLWRALTALKSMYDHGSVRGNHLKSEGDPSGDRSGTRTPLPTAGAKGLIGPPVLQQLRGLTPSSAAAAVAAAVAADPREDAAMAMAEMQNGASLQDFAGSVTHFNTYDQDLTNRHRMSFSQQADNPNMAIENLPSLNVDPTQYMAPMDLYESIWGGTYDLSY